MLIIIDSVFVLVFLFFVERFSASGVWFWNFALPVVALVALFLIVNIICITHKVVKGLNVYALILVCVGLVCFCIETVLNLNFWGHTSFTGWSVYVAALNIAAAVILIFIERKKRLKHALKKKLHI